VHAFPEADVPVLQLSINAQKPYEYHLALGAALAPLRDRGVMVIGSGNVVHNLRRIDWSRPDGGFDWAERFDADARQIMASDPSDLPRLQDHDAFDLAVPTPDHFIPLLYVAGLAAVAGSSEVLVDGCSMGSLSMTSYGVGSRREPAPDSVEGAPPLPHEPPAEQTNI
jgi:4,5-DOPA dioxygenase extradiol